MLEGMPGNSAWQEPPSPVSLPSGSFSQTVPEWVGLYLYSFSISSCPVSNLNVLGTSLGERVCMRISHSLFQNLQVPGVSAFTTATASVFEARFHSTGPVYGQCGSRMLLFKKKKQANKKQESTQPSLALSIQLNSTLSLAVET